MLLNALGRILSASFIDRPVFVVGCSRSGTSVLLQALGQHRSLISAPGEAPFLTSVGGAVALFEISDSREYYNRSLNVSKPYLFNELKRLALEVAAGEDYGIRTFAKTCLARRSLIRPRRWCAKTFPTKLVADALRSLYPEARFVYIVRNGLEVVQSMTKYEGFRQRDFERHCQTWAASMSKFEYLLDYPGAIALRHEQLRTDAEAVFNRLIKALGLMPDRRVVDFVKSTVVHPLDQRTESHTDASSEFAKRAAPYETWNDEQRRLFVEVCRVEMDKAGYEIPFAS